MAAPVINCSPNTTQIVFNWNAIMGDKNAVNGSSNKVMGNENGVNGNNIKPANNWLLAAIARGFAAAANFLA